GTKVVDGLTPSDPFRQDRDGAERDAGGEPLPHGTISGWRWRRNTGETRVSSIWSRKPIAAATRQVSAPYTAPRSPPRAAPIGRAPVAVMLIADARPSRSRGVTVWRSVAVLMTQTIGPTPTRKKLSPARTAAGIQIVSTIT